MSWVRISLLLVCSARAISTRGAEFPLWDGKENTAEYAKRVNLPAEQSLDLGKGVKLDLVLIPAGKFVMGSAPAPAPLLPYYTVYIAAGGCAVLGLVWLISLIVGRRKHWAFPRNVPGLLLLLLILGLVGGAYYIRNQWKHYTQVKELFDKAPDWERPTHEVTNSAPFYMGKFEVTQQQYEALAGSNPSKAVNASFPVEMVSWIDARAFCEKLATKTGKHVQLPTEAQWEYACRAGTTTLFNWGNELDLSRANVKGDKIMPVGSFKPNAFGLQDMHGNVWEWCNDYYADAYYKESPPRDPPGPVQSPYGNARVLRGGSCRGDPDFYRSASRRWLSADDSDDDIGFRLLVPVDH
jgi:formylglycine-generating enzyme required for sulfatase activity